MISIIVVGHNSKKDLGGCFDSISESTYKKYKTIYVDCGSSDGSANFARENFPKIQVLEESNLGYAGGNNVGIREALKQKSDYIFILNPDTIVDKNCLKNLMSKARPDTILQPIILLYKNGRKTNLINTTGNYLNFLGFGCCRDYLKENRETESREIAFPSGAALFAPSEIFQKVGGFDEDFFMYLEDLDFGFRARKSGFNARLVPSAKIYHKYSFSQNKLKFYHAEKNRLAFLLKNFSLKYLLLITPIFFINEFFVVLYSLASGQIVAKFSSYGYVLREFKKLQSGRKGIGREGLVKKFIGPKLILGTPSLLFFVWSVVLAVYWFIIYIFI